MWSSGVMQVQFIAALIQTRLDKGSKDQKNARCTNTLTIHRCDQTLKQKKKGRTK